MKLSRMIVIVAGIIILAVIVVIPLLNGDTKGEDTVDKNIMISPIDAARPTVTETATFALG